MVEGYFEFHREEETSVIVRVNCYQPENEGAPSTKMNVGEAKIVLSDYISAAGIDTAIRLPLFIMDEMNQPYETGMLTAQVAWIPDPVPEDYESPNFADQQDEY